MNARILAGVLLTVAVSACGTTVPLSQQVQTSSPDGGIGLSGSTTGGVAAPGAATPGATGGVTTGALTTSGSATGSTGHGTSIGGSTGATPAAGTSGSTGVTAPQSSGPTSNSPVSVGFMAIKDIGAAAGALGIDASSGSGSQQVKADVKLINAHGGLGGHPIVPVIYEFDGGGDLKSQFAAACAQFFEDNKVKAIVAIATDDILRQCALKHQTPMVDLPSAQSASNVAKFSNLVQPDMPTIEGAARVMVDGLVNRGWFRPSSATETIKVGLLTHDGPNWSNVKGVVAARLKAAGLSLQASYAMPETDVGSAAAAGRSAALRFRQDGVNRVVAIDRGGFALSWFALGASGQGYYPLLGMTTLSNPVGETVALPARSLQGAAAIGWAPMYDVAPADQPATSPRTALCIKAMTDAGQDMSSPLTRLGAMLGCEGTWLLADAFRAGTIGLSAFVQGAARLGTGYKAVSTLGTDFSRSRAAADAYRYDVYRGDCGCFRYTGPSQRFGFSPGT